ncbi:DUF2505 domain-containing protein [Cellulomonas sp. PhB143]|uniref:DUF2505 domain-containing protein n=1 Tax=Cellulomonas sp. PhB143 TaxID=2485186 RepID=UPI000F48679B|nr:DUF2505 domain-containing protein [Cellulomonas sp. PhB143]ROS78593.1 uncharacterized protein DUF2505 [Cellulomonas sp. PhB143]
MHVTVTQTYDAPVETVVAMLADVDFVRWRADRSSGEGSVEQAEVAGTPAAGFTVSVRRTLPGAAIPAQARALVGDRLEVRQVEVWEAGVGPARAGTVTLEISGAPVRLTGTLTLAETADGGTRQTYDGEVRASVPLFGAVVERAAADAVRDALAAEESATREWIAQGTAP